MIIFDDYGKGLSGDIRRLRKIVHGKHGEALEKKKDLRRRRTNSSDEKQRDPLTWLNHHLTKIWPYVDEAASVLIRASVEPDLEQYRPAVVASLTFSKLTLGTVAPQFTGVSIIEGDENGMTMELDMNWDGNPNIVLGIKTLGCVSLPVQADFRPLVDEFPCFGAVSVSLREKETIQDAVEDSITWPVRKVIPILTEDSIITLSFSSVNATHLLLILTPVFKPHYTTSSSVILKNKHAIYFPFSLLHVDICSPFSIEFLKLPSQIPCSANGSRHAKTPLSQLLEILVGEEPI
ncbi:Uncharacterized protein Rs2_32048 [Raphanus sativus]|nr:Uncharacterized protein Rs2_32048 [Raphanus sativus]